MERQRGPLYDARMCADGPPLLEMLGIRKSFGAVPVLAGVDFTLRAGELHALCGENGAGKSTLIKILAGVHTDFEGALRLRGQPVRFSSPRAATDRGIAVIYQELSLVPHLTVAENILLGREPRTRLHTLDRAALRRTAQQHLADTLGVTLDVDRPVAELPIAAQQLVEIAKALARQADLLVLDEPTSALPDADAARLFAALRALRARGVGLVYISHRLEEIYALADRITVLRDGRLVGTATPAALPPPRLIEWMVGRQVAELHTRRAPPPGPVRLNVAGLGLRDPAGQRWLLRDVSLAARAGEIVGLAGLMGAGASELLGALYGRFGRPAAGQVHVADRLLTHFDPATALARGVALLTNDRKASGLVLPMSVLQNVSLATLRGVRRGGLLSTARERAAAAPLAARLNLRTPGWGHAVSVLSGGNQQKVLLARWLLTGPRVLLLDEPTRGIDVGAKRDIYALLDELTAAGLAIVLITSELPELLALADRIVVLHRGRVAAELPRTHATPERVMQAAVGFA
jgi:ribose transport system ATP-binding protein